MLTPKIMVECINMLLLTIDEEQLECLCKLLTTVGQKLEESIRQTEDSNSTAGREKRAIKWIPEPKFMDNTFRKLKELSISKSLSSRIRFALLVSVFLGLNNAYTCAYKCIQALINAYRGL